MRRLVFLLPAAALSIAAGEPDHYQSSSERRTVVDAREWGPWAGPFREKLVPSLMQDFGERYIYAPANAALPPPAKGEDRVVFIGDSITDLWDLAKYFRRDEPLWREVAAMDVPETLAHKLEVWDACGRIPLYDLESHQEPSWVAVLVGQGVLPRGYSPRADILPEDQVRGRMEQRCGFLAQVAERMPAHDEFISRTCAARELA